MRTLAVLISSAGRRVSLFECFRRAAADLNIKVRLLACDAEPTLSAGCRVADEAFQVPPCEDPRFIDVICDLAQRHGVALVVPTIDPELEPLAAASSRFASFGTRVLVSPPAVIKVARDKLETARVLNAAGVPVPVTASLAEVRDRPSIWPWPLFMKPRSGSASRGLSRINAPKDLPGRAEEAMILQEFLDGPEYTVNIFINLEGALRAAIPHRRLQVRAGEVEKGLTERDPVFFELAQDIVRALPEATGVLCFQLIVDRRLGPKVLEVNARFGGGYPLADHAGGKFARWLLEEALGLPSSANDSWREGVLMLRYDAAFFLQR
jgi:carbamoyl-phosphate synthase large subunit